MIFSEFYFYLYYNIIIFIVKNFVMKNMKRKIIDSSSNKARKTIKKKIRKRYFYAKIFS